MPTVRSMITFLDSRNQRRDNPLLRFPSITQVTKDVAWGGPSSLRKVLGSGAVDKIRSQDFTQYSDRDLIGALDSLKECARSDPSEQIQPAVCALISEAINRRLGAWRMFGSPVSEPGLQKYQNMAAQISQSDSHRIQPSSCINEDLLGCEVFGGSLTALPDRWNLDSDEREIVRTLVYVAERSKSKYSSRILLSAKFYQALERKDTKGVAAFRVTDEQLLAGILLYQGNVVELNSGEGKTIAAAFPAVLHAILGKSVHVITANDYLATRDLELLMPVYESLELTVDAVLSYLSDEERRDAYTKQIVYGTLREFGFDFMRDNLKSSREEQVQRKLEVAIIDEADHALIDEANTPLIIGGAPTGTKRSIARVKNAVRQLISRQARVARSLAEQVDVADRKSAELHLLLAKLLLAQPDNSTLTRLLTDNPHYYKRVRALIDQDESEYPDSELTRDLLYAIDPQNRFVTLTERGQDFLETCVGQFFDAQAIEREIASVAQSKDMPLAKRRRATAKLARQLSRRYNSGNQVYQMLRGHLLLKKDVDYLVTEDSIVLIDKFTGRPRPDSRYQQGLHAALEAKENVTLRPEYEVLAQISVQGFVSQYGKVSGMTGTALSSRDEFLQMYGLDVQVVPPNQPSMRVDLGHRIYAARQDMLSALADEVQFCWQVGRPVLVATLTIEQSEEISHLLTERGVPHNVLNAVSCHDEARIVKEAGNFGAVTVATNMAGRGTDIVLQPDLYNLIAGRYRDLARQLLSEGFGCVALNCYTKEEADILWGELSGCGAFTLTRQKRNNLEKLLVTPGADGNTAGESISLDFGLGLYVIGSELNQSRRIDLQLRGRSGRQGELGLSRFFLSQEDDLFVHSAAGAVYPSCGKEVDRAGRVYLEGQGVDRQLDGVQKIMEGDGESRRRLVQDYVSVLDSRTLFYYRARQGVMECAAFRDACLKFAREEARYIVDYHFPRDIYGDYGRRFGGMLEELQEDFHIDCSGLRGFDADQLIESIGDLLVANLEEMESRFGQKGVAELAKLLFLRTSDELWKEHFLELQELMFSIQQGIRGHQAALSEFVSQASTEWKSFRQRVLGSFLSRLFTFPIGGVPAQPVVEGHSLEIDLAQDVALVLV